MKRTYTFDSWPYKIDFDYLENLEIEYYPAKVLCKSFFLFLNIPKIISFSFFHVFTATTESELNHGKKITNNYESQFFKFFDNVFSLDDEYIVKGNFKN